MATKPRKRSGPQAAAAAAAAPEPAQFAGGGAAPLVRTVIYVHGIGNKPMPSVLKCQWDTALFRTRMGDRTRMAYWVNRARYPEPVDATCANRDSVAVDDDQATAAVIMAVSASATPAEATDPFEPLQRQIAALTNDAQQLQVLRAIADRINAYRPSSDGVATAMAAGSTIRVLPLAEPLRRLVTAQLTRALAPDVYEFLFDPERRDAMMGELLSRLVPSDGPFAVIAHSQGSMVAFEALQSLKKGAVKVELFVTLGSPLGLQEIKDSFNERKIPLRVPACVTHWINVADPIDPIAIDASLADEYAAQPGGKAIEDIRATNWDSRRDPHSATGYLKTKAVQQAIIEVAGGALSQPIGRTVVSSDLVEQMEDAPETPQEVLIELAEFDRGSGAPRPLTKVGEMLEMRLTELSALRLAKNLAPIKIDRLQRFVAADLIRSEIETLRTEAVAAGVHRIWRNSVKRTQIDQSAATVQATTANLGYVADGRNIGWAVIDTGISASHLHFAKHKNVRVQWDCLKPGDPREVDAQESAFFDRNGHGTHVAGVIAGCMSGLLLQGRPTRMAGMAPAADLYGFRTLDAAGRGRDSSIIKALEQIARINDGAGRLVIHGVNLSLGSAFDPRLYGCGHTPLCDELRRLWRQGVLVCVAAGNEGFMTLQGPSGPVDANLDLTIGDPANLDEAIAVGSVHKTNPHTYGVSYFSSRGPTADGRRKPDLVAPGERILSAKRGASTDPVPDGAEVSAYYVEMSGTSMATPHVSGLLAGFLSARREFIGYPDRVKRILLDNCTDLQRDPYAQGAGLANMIKMLVAT